MFFGFFDPTIIILIPAMIFTFIAQGKVKSAYARYSRIPVKRRITGGQVARMILDHNNMGHVPIEIIGGTMSDNYDPKNDVMHLSQEVCNDTSIASVSIAAHESGHAIQDGSNYGFLKFRSAIAPVVSFVSGAAWPLMIIGLILGAVGNNVTTGTVSFGSILFDIGIICFCTVVLFQAVTLPVEFNASKRALQQLVALGIVDEEERIGAKKMLSAAAMTYVAALSVAVLNLIRILLIRGRN